MSTTRRCSALIFFAVYVAVSALSIPGAAILTLLGGTLFSLWEGTVLVSFASTLGPRWRCSPAVICCATGCNGGLPADEYGEYRYGARRRELSFALRLMPLFPFFLVNLLMGLTRMEYFATGGSASSPCCPPRWSFSTPGASWKSDLAARYFVAGHAIRLYTTGVIAAGHPPAVFPLSSVKK
jgi:hypothetical protein